MTRTTWLVAGALAGLIQVAVAQGTPRTVSGRVFDDTTGCPLRGVQVHPVGSTSRALTDVQGRYRLGGLPDGNFVLEAVRAGYLARQTLPMMVRDSSKRVDFSLLRAPADSAGRANYPRKACQLEPPDDRPGS
jgi:hypothetical protein